jgi:hypothetical protein
MAIIAPVKFTEPQQPDFGVIGEIHRGLDGFVPFAIKDEWGEWINELPK